MRNRRWALIAVVAAVLAGLALWSSLSPPSVQVAAVQRGPLADALSATGVVEAAQVNVTPKIVGRIVKLLVDEGDSVERGQLLARLDDSDQVAAVNERRAALQAAQAEVARTAATLALERAASRARIDRARAAEEAARSRLAELKAGTRPEEIESARQAVAAAEAEAALAAANFERISRLYAQGAVSQAEVDRARTRLASAQAALRTAREQLALAEAGPRSEQIAAAAAEVVAAGAQLAEAQAAAGQVEVLKRTLAAAEAAVEQTKATVAAAQTSLAETRVTAPMSGRVGRRHLDVGDLTGPGSPVFLIADNENLWVAAEVDEEDLALVHEGQRVSVSAEALARPLPGEVVEVAPVALSRGLQQVRAKIVRAKIVLDGNTGLLRAGMEVDVYADAVLSDDALLVPADALIEADGSTSVLVVDSGRIHRREVEVGRRTFKQAAVLSGLSEGELVVVSGKDQLKEGQRVSPHSE